MSALIHQNIRHELDDLGVEISSIRDVDAGVETVLDRLRTRGLASSRPLSVGDPRGLGNAGQIKRWLDKIGYPQCRVWGAEAPQGRDQSGCPLHKKLCIIPLPMRHTVPASATAETYEVQAKLWYWPIMFVDGGSTTAISVTDLTYTGDPVFENGTGSGSWIPTAAFSPQANYNVMPGLPAIDNTNGLVFTFANSTAGALDFQGMFLGVSIRN